MAGKKRKKQKKQRLFNGLLLRLVAAAMMFGCAFTIVSTERDCTEKEHERAAIQSKIEEYENENSELQRVLESDDLSAYMEKVAIEERGYAYPDERRFYDTSRD